MNEKVLCAAILASILVLVNGECKNPKISVEGFTTKDATIVSQIGYISSFTVDCGESVGPSLFAEIDGKIVPVARSGENTYQVSWSEDVKKSRSGNIPIRLFDEEGFAEIRKAQRAGDALSSVEALAEIVLNHPGAYKGPWVNSELVAAAVSAFVSYFAFSAKSKILS